MSLEVMLPGIESEECDAFGVFLGSLIRMRLGCLI